MPDDTQQESRKHSTEENGSMLASAVATVLLLISLLALSVYLFGDGATAGPNQFALALCALFAAILAQRKGYVWDEIVAAVIKGISIALPAIFILFAVGALIGTWAMSGTIVAMIYYGLEFMNLEFFFVSTCFISALISISIGSSWTVAGTLGVGLMGIAEGVGLSPAIAAGAVISGVYFGDKASPLSDATNLAAAVAESNVFKHIRYSLITSLPALLIALVGFLLIDLNQTVEISQGRVIEIQSLLTEHFNISWLSLLPLVVVLVMVVKGLSAFLSLMTAALVGGLLAVYMQPDVVLAFSHAENMPAPLAMLEAVWRALSNGFSIETGVEGLDNLLSRGGMESMLSTIWLILMALAFGSVLDFSGMLRALLQPVIDFATTTGRLFLSVVTTGFGINVLAADQYIAIALPGRIFAKEFRKRELAPVNLSRLIGDSSTVTSALVPWNTCGAYMAVTLGVGTFSYLPYAFFNIANPIISILIGAFGVKIATIGADDKKIKKVELTSPPGS